MRRRYERSGYEDMCYGRFKPDTKEDIDRSLKVSGADRYIREAVEILEQLRVEADRTRFLRCRRLEPMDLWVRGEGRGCRPCRIAAGVGRYRKALEDAGQEGLIEILRVALFDDDDTVNKIALAMDEVKIKAPSDVRESLQSIDSEIQNV